jgi:hypothetical protein
MKFKNNDDATSVSNLQRPKGPKAQMAKGPKAKTPKRPMKFDEVCLE